MAISKPMPAKPSKAAQVQKSGQKMTGTMGAKVTDGSKAAMKRKGK